MGWSHPSPGQSRAPNHIMPIQWWIATTASVTDEVQETYDQAPNAGRGSQVQDRQTLCVVGKAPLTAKRSAERWLVLRMQRSRSGDVLDIREYVLSSQYSGFTTRAVRIPAQHAEELAAWAASGEVPQYPLEIRIEPSREVICNYYEHAKYGQYIDLRYFTHKPTYEGARSGNSGRSVPVILAGLFEVSRARSGRCLVL